jgi:tricorn protease
MQTKSEKWLKVHYIFSIFSIILLLFIGKSYYTPVYASDIKPLLRFPDIHENSVIFVYGEDIWQVPANGGVATRLTINDGEEQFPKFSPDGKWIAFTGDYDGNSDVYVMNTFGGEITRVTFHPDYDEVVGWHPVKNKIMFRSRRHSFSYFSKLFLITPQGTDLEELILNEASQGSFSADGEKIAYNKLSRENSTWKRYRGGTAQEVYIYDFETGEDRNITNFEGTDRIPMWIENKIYFTSDRNRVLNIYAYDTQTGQIEQITEHTEYDVRRPSMGGHKIVYELGGTLWLLDVENKESKQIPIEILSDAPETRPYLKKVDEYITNIDCSPGGERALIVARGELFTVPQKHGPTRNLTNDSGSRDKDAVWSPDGKNIVYISDKSGEYEIYVIGAGNEQKSQRLTQHKDGYRHTLCWSPDSKKIAFADQTLRCYILDVSTRKITEIDKSDYENVDVSLDKKLISDYSWSPDSRFLAYSKMNQDLVYQLYVYSLETGQTHIISDHLFYDFNPVFSKDGEHLFFISNRCFDPTFCDFEWEMVYKKVAGIYCLTLKKDGKPLLPFQSDEVEIPKAESTKKEENKKDIVDEKKNIIIDFENISARIEALPLSRGNYRNLAVNETDIFYLNKEEGDFNRFEFREMGPMTLYAFSIKDREERKIIENIDEYKLSADGSKIIYKKGNSVGIIESNGKESEGELLDLSDLKIWLDPLAEWKQIFNECWRMERDFYYESAMHGLDWNGMKEKYGKLIGYASCRQDVRYLIGELIGELNTSHTYVYEGDQKRQAERVNVGLLGADFEVDKNNNRYYFKKIYRVTDWTQGIVPPLLGPGILVNQGDFLLRVNGQEVTADKNIYSYFQDLAEEQVKLTINKQPNIQGAREVIVKPLGDDNTLRYLDWVEHNRFIADSISNGEIGYIHLMDTYTGSAREFPKYFYSQLRKKGLIVDGRFNAGGLDPDIFLHRLDTKPMAYWTRRYSHDQTVPDIVTNAHMVCLTNKYAGSGGDMLPMEFRMRNMGPIIGTRTWGGLVGISMFVKLIDGGTVTVPDYRIYDTNGNWIIENEGVEPDIVVDLQPKEVARGYDAQLMTGIKILIEKINKEPRSWPQHLPYPTDN